MTFSGAAIGGAMVLLAEDNTWGSALELVRKGWAGLDLALWGGLLTTLAVVWWMSAIFLRRRSRMVRKIDNSQRLFRDLCRAHGLSWSESGLLEQLAEARGLDEPGVLFVRDDYYVIEDLDGALAEHAAALTKLGEKLFRNVELAARNPAQATEPAQTESAV